MGTNLTQRTSPIWPQSQPARSGQQPRTPGRTTLAAIALGSVLGRLLRAISFWSKRSRDRRLLASLNSRMLRDIGFDHVPAENDSTTWFWRLR